MRNHTAESLRAFERQVADKFNAGLIRAPVHLAGDNEEQLIELFDQVNENDWVCTQWRSHYHCLLKGVPPDDLMADILAGKSITLNYPQNRIVSSAIVGGVLPIALGIAWSIRAKGSKCKVWAFVGDMTAMGGMFHECHQYAAARELPICFVIENNFKSVCTDTDLAWGTERAGRAPIIQSYSYALPWPHAGAGKRVQF